LEVRPLILWETRLTHKPPESGFMDKQTKEPFVTALRTQSANTLGVESADDPQG